MTSPSLQEQKRQCRRELRKALGGLGAKDRKASSLAIREHLQEVLPASGRIAAFVALPDEPDLLNEDFSRKWILPRVASDKDITLYEVSSPEELTPGAFGILEPEPARCPSIRVEEVDCFLVPGLGFDPRSGFRIGRGKGFYDRLLSQARPDCRLLGITFSCQLGAVPREPHDIPMDLLVTEKAIVEPDPR